MKYTDHYNGKGLEMLKQREAELGVYHVGNWRFLLTERGEFCVSFDYDISDWYDMEDKEDFSAVIMEAKKHGYNVNAEFLATQVSTIMSGYKQERFLPDRSGRVFSPIKENGIQFRFLPIGEDSTEYVC